MSFAATLARQLAAPSGVVGMLCGAAMDMANRVPLQMAVDLLTPVDGEMLLDAGCGTGAASEAMRRRADCRIVAIDQSETMVRRARSRLAKACKSGTVVVHQAMLEELPCRPGSIDAALALNIFYFCGPDGSMIRAIREALRPDGRLVAYVTDRDSMQRWSFTRVGLHRLYDGEGLQAALVDGGFDPARVTITKKSIAPGISGLFALAFAG
ncbi:class I SAM-dependent methyltransferase [Sphingobium chlorophenolicum]|uniref:Methyltransferase type 11 n=1 Tax=Sphingobium chlorophenolicum TaxID=46429 RepID=A0A081RCG1_SPHCR|nr:class I SAM-dependent methyltransferase [Sphingobium chlorophenolicum]KEQ52884.1 Methyltransferase type 11 [Sphingobium chlorophenolicum]